MDIFKGIRPLAIWMLRLSLSIWLVIIYSEAFLNFNLDNILFFKAALMMLGVLLLILGGFQKKGVLTVIGASVLLITHTFIFFQYFNGFNEFLGVLLTRWSICLYFLLFGNKTN